MDKALLEKYMLELQDGNLSALDGIYTLTSKSVYLLAFSILKNSEKAKDMMHDTFVRMTANIDKYRPSTNALAWISTIARNISYREYKNAQRSLSLDALGEQHGCSDDFWTDKIDLNRAMGKLSVEEREIVTLFSIEGYKHREIAEIVGKPLGTVLWMYSRAIKKLKKIMDEEQ